MAGSDLRNLSVDTSALHAAAKPSGLPDVAAKISALKDAHHLTDPVEFTDPTVTGFPVGTDLDTLYQASVDALVGGPDNSLATIAAHVSDLGDKLGKAAAAYDTAHAKHQAAADEFVNGIRTT